MTDRGFYDALWAAANPVDFVHAVADQPFSWDLAPGDRRGLIDERDAIVSKARAFQGQVNVLADIVPLLRDAAVELRRGPTNRARDALVDRLVAMIDRLDGRAPWALTDPAAPGDPVEQGGGI